MAYRRARSLDTLVNQVNAMAPNRRKASDGWIGDQAHRNRKSDHNPNSRGVVQAQDITHDPANGADMRDLTERIKNDERVKYIIFDRRIWNPSVARRWRPYSGSNPHTVHAHISVSNNAMLYDNTRAWNIGTQREEDEMTPEQEKRILHAIDHLGDRVDAIEKKVDQTNWFFEGRNPKQDLKFIREGVRELLYESSSPNKDTLPRRVTSLNV